MMFLMALLWVLVSSILVCSLNPVKMVFTLMMLSLTMFIYLFMSNSSIWLSSIYFLIFIGGIMIMFMILSSLLPNEKSLKIKSILVSMLITLLITFGGTTMISQMEVVVNREMKLMFLSNESFEVLMMVILLYFLSFIYIVSKENCSLRSFTC